MPKLPLADRYARAKQLADAANRIVAELRAEILASNCDALAGERFLVRVTHGVRETLDTGKAKVFLTPTEINACVIRTDYVRVNVAPLADFETPAPADPRVIGAAVH